MSFHLNLKMMQLLTIFATMVAVAYADSYLYPVPSQKLQSPVLVVKTTQQELPTQVQQYFNQDSLGQYSYGYTEPLSTKQEVRTLDGITRGSYSYIDAHGLIQTVDYTADADGFHVAATNLPIDRQEAPKAVTDTPEVVEAREQHLAAHRALHQGDISSSAILPQPVQDTPEVMAAKRDFFARYAAEEERHKYLQKSALLKSQGLMTSFATTVPLLPTLERPKYTSVSHQSPVKPQTKSDNVNTAGVKYGIHYTVPSNLPRFYLPIV